MTCEDLEARIAEFLAGELEDRPGVEEHLVACAECRGKFSIARSGWQAADEWRVSGPSGDAIAATLVLLGPVAPSKPLLRFLQAGTMAASLVIAFVIGTSPREIPVVEKPAPVATKQVKPASAGLASLRPSVGVLFAQDENGRPAGELAISRLKVSVDLRDGIARTEIEEVFQNRTDQRLEGTFQFPLPPDASISRLAMEIDGKLMEGEVVERQKARQTYEGIVRSMKDPALLEWMPGGMFQCRIFPIEPRSDKRIVIAYTQALSVFDGRARYVYPLAGESMRELGIGRFEFAAMIRSGSKIVKAASTSHDAPTIRLNDHAMRTTFAFSDFRPRSDFVIAFETEVKDEIQVSAHRPEGAEPGYFAAFVTPRIDRDEELRRDRKLFFLVDVSGSVAGPELEAARLVIRRMIDALGPADRFRIGCHNLMVGAMTESVAPDEAGKRAADRYLADLAAAGASDVATALETTLSHYMADNGELVYVGEGTPTWGEKDPAKIVARLRAAVGARRISIRTVAVGSDAEKNLLETISREFNGGSHAVSPSDDVASRADEIARTLGRSALSHLKAEFEGAVTDAAPGTLGSIHFGERLLVTGRYGTGPVKLILTGKVHDRTVRKEFALALPEREAGNLHVKRLWAQRRLADLVAQGDAKRDETVKLSVAHQVMTPHTSFLVLENEKAYEQHRIDRTKKDADQSSDPAKKQVVKAEPRREADTPADEHYRLAVRYYDSGDFERAEVEAQKALTLNPNHGASHALMLEVQFALGKGRVTPQSLEFESIIQMATARQQQVIFELREAMDKGLRDFNLGKYDDAERQFRTVMEYAKWLPSGPAIDAQQKQASEMLAKLPTTSTPAVQRPLGQASPAVKQGVGGQGGGAGEELRDGMRVQIERGQLEITSLIREGDRNRAAGDYDTALRQFEEAEFKIKSIPYNLKTMKELLPRVQEYVRRTREASLESQKARGESQRALSGNEAAAYERARQREVIETIARLLEQAYLAFDQKKFNKCIDLCDEMIAIDPRYAVAIELKEDVQKVRHRESYYDFLRAKVENWKKLTDRDPETVIPYADTVVIPNAEEWAEIAKRSTSFAGLQGGPPANRRGILGSDDSDVDIINRPPVGGYDIAGVGFTDIDEPAGQGTLGKLIGEGDGSRISGVLSLDDIDPDGGGGPPALQPYDPEDGARYRLARSYRLPLSGPYIRDYDIQVATAAVAADPIPPSQVEWDVLHRKLVGEQPRLWGINQSVAIPGSELSETLRLLVEEPQGRAGGIDKLVAGVNTYGRELELQLMQISDAMAKVEEGKKRRSDAFNKLSTSEQDRQFKTQEVERLSKDLGVLEDQYQQLAQDRQKLQESIAALTAVPVQTDRVAPRKSIAAQVTAVAAELDLVVISVGRDAGVNEGDDFTVYRGAMFLGKVTIDRVDRAWSSGRVVLKGKEEPLVGDTVTNGVLAAPGKLEEVRPQPSARKVVTITGDEVAISGVDPARVKRGSCFVLSRDWKYVAAVEVTRVTDSTATARILPRFRSSTIQEGDLAVRVGTFADLWSVLPDSIRKELLSERALAEARAKLRILRAMKGGAR